MVLWIELENQVEIHIQEFLRIYKCVNKRNLPKQETVNLHVQNLIKEFNALRILYIKNSEELDTKKEFLELLYKYRDKLIRIFKHLKLNIKVPIINKILVDITIIDSDIETESEVEDDNIIEKMAITVFEFSNYAAKIIPLYDGVAEELQRFIDAITLVKTNVGEFEATAVEIVKSKLKDPARSFITNEATLQAIIDKLKSNIKPESTTLIISKLKNLKQSGKSSHI